MALSLLAPVALRPQRAAVLLVPAVLAAAAVGCGHHKRTSLRPVYVTPAAPPCPSGNCGGSAVVPSRPTTTVVEPALSDPIPAAPAAEAPPSPPPASTSATLGGAPPLSGPAVQSFPDEPGLEPAGAESSSKVVPPADNPAPGKNPAPRSPRSGGSGGPSASLKSSGAKRTAPPRVRQAALGDRLRPFVNDPADLFSPPKADRPWKYIVLHHSASPTGSYDSIDREHRERLGWQGCGYHFVIGNGSGSPDGRIEVAQRWTNQKLGVHCRDGKHPDINEYGIGICLVGDLEKDPPTARQIAAARALVAYLGDRYGISSGHAETHAHLAASPTSCPGRHFPARDILGNEGLALR